MATLAFSILQPLALLLCLVIGLDTMMAADATRPADGCPSWAAGSSSLLVVGVAWDNKLLIYDFPFGYTVPLGNLDTTNHQLYLPGKAESIYEQYGFEIGGNVENVFLFRGSQNTAMTMTIRRYATAGRSDMNYDISHKHEL